MTREKLRLLTGTALILACTMLSACGGTDTKSTTQESAYTPPPAATVTTERSYRR